MGTYDSIPGLLVCANSIIKISKNNELICFGNSWDRGI